MKCSALNVDFNCVRLDPLGSKNPPYKRIKFGYPIENVRFLLLSTNLAREWLQIDRLAACHNKHCWRASRGYQHRWPWTTLNPQNMGFKWFYCYFVLRRTLGVNFRWNILETDQNNLRTKFVSFHNSVLLTFLNIIFPSVYYICAGSTILQYSELIKI